MAIAIGTRLLVRTCTGGGTHDFHPFKTGQSRRYPPDYHPVMPSQQTEITRNVLARITFWLVAGLAGSMLFAVVFQRPLGISIDGVRIAERIFFANLMIALLVAQFYFPRPRFPRKHARRKSSTARSEP
jgi:hypothetical protein